MFKYAFPELFQVSPKGHLIFTYSVKVFTCGVIVLLFSSVSAAAHL